MAQPQENELEYAMRMEREYHNALDELFGQIGTNIRAMMEHRFATRGWNDIPINQLFINSINVHYTSAFSIAYDRDNVHTRDHINIQSMFDSLRINAHALVPYTIVTIRRDYLGNPYGSHTTVRRLFDGLTIPPNLTQTKIVKCENNGNLYIIGFYDADSTAFRYNTPNAVVNGQAFVRAIPMLAHTPIGQRTTEEGINQLLTKHFTDLTIPLDKINDITTEILGQLPPLNEKVETINSNIDNIYASCKYNTKYIKQFDEKISSVIAIGVLLLFAVIIK